MPRKNKDPKTKQNTPVNGEIVVDKTPRALDSVGVTTLVALLTYPTKTEAAEKLGIDRTTLYLRIEKYDLNKHIEALPQEALQTLRLGSVRAAENFVQKIEHLDPEISIKASQEILDRVGLAAKKESGPANQINIFTQILQKEKDEFGI